MVIAKFVPDDSPTSRDRPTPDNVRPDRRTASAQVLDPGAYFLGLLLMRLIIYCDVCACLSARASAMALPMPA